MRKIIFTLFAFCNLGFANESAYALNTAASFDISYSLLSLKLSTFAIDPTTGVPDDPTERTLSSQTGIQIDYNIALFDYKSVATVSFLQYATSSLGPRPLTRIAIGGSYHFIRMNGQRIVLDNQVEAKSWGISPALELTAGLSYLSIKDPRDQSFEFNSSMIDIIPRLLVEIPASPSFLIMFRAGYAKSLSMFGGNTRYNANYSGYILNLGIKLTTL